MDFSPYEQYVDFIYTTLLMVWGGSCIGIGLVAVPFIFDYIDSTTEASQITSRILKKQDILIRVTTICMIALFYAKSSMTYSYQRIEWITYVSVLHCYIIGKIVSSRLWKLRDQIDTFDTPMGEKPKRKQFHRWHIAMRVLYSGQIIGVIILLYLHAFGL